MLNERRNRGVEYNVLIFNLQWEADNEDLPSEVQHDFLLSDGEDIQKAIYDFLLELSNGVEPLNYDIEMNGNEYFSGNELEDDVWQPDYPIEEDINDPLNESVRTEYELDLTDQKKYLIPPYKIKYWENEDFRDENIADYFIDFDVNDLNSAIYYADKLYYDYHKYAVAVLNKKGKSIYAIQSEISDEWMNSQHYKAKKVKQKIQNTEDDDDYDDYDYEEDDYKYDNELNINEIDVIKYYNSIDNPKQYSIKALTFGYLLNMNPSECEDMQVEPEFTQEQEDEYDDVESIISGLYK